MLLVVPDQLTMGCKSKWIEVESPAESAVDVARRGVRARLSAVWDWLPAAAAQSMPDARPEPVHQLRVATRRAMAVLQIFQELLPEKRRIWFQRRLKKIRKAAGEARDLDVLAKRLESAADQHSSPACQALLERVQRARQIAQQPIIEVYEKLRSRHFSRRIKRLIKKVRWRDHQSDPPMFSAFARTAIIPVASAFFSAAEADLNEIEALHQFRIVGKQLRYAMEVFAAAFGPSFRRDIYPLVEQLQAMLGEINDHATGRDRYLDWLDETEEESQRLILGELIAVETSALQESVRRFRHRWTAERAADLKVRFWREITPAETRCA